MAASGGNEDLWDCDPELFGLIKQEKQRQLGGLEFIASENFVSKAVHQVFFPF